MPSFIRHRLNSHRFGRHTLSARARWAVPAGAVAGVGIIIAAAAVASAEAAPALPPRTAQQLLTEVAQSAGKATGPFTATVQETSNLGLPQLPSIAQQAGGPSDTLSGGTQSVSIWYGGPQRIRLAEPTRGGESDLRLDGRTLWLWDSKTQTATRYVLQAGSSGVKLQPRNGALRRLRPNAKGSPLGQPLPATPQAAARQILSAVGPTTVVSVQRNVYVAGRAAYQLALVPRSSKSLVGQVLIAIDASRHIPLRVEVFPRGSSTVAYSFGYTSLTFGAPAASNFSFTPPPGAKVRTETVPSNLKSGLGLGGLGSPGLGGLGLNGLGLSGLSSLGLSSLGLGTLSPSSVGFSAPAGITVHNALSPGQMGTTVKPGAATFAPAARSNVFGNVMTPGQKLSKAAIERLKAQFEKTLPKSMTAAERANAIAVFDKHFLRLFASSQLKAVANGAAKSVRVHKFVLRRPFAARPGQPKVKTIGSSWLTVVATPPSAQVAQAVSQALSGSVAVAPSAVPPSPGTSYSVTISSSDPNAAVSSSSQATAVVSQATAPGPEFAVLHALLKAMTPVHGSWGSGRLLQTRMLTVLITSKGQILAGAVTPAVLYADVALDAS